VRRGFAAALAAAVLLAAGCSDDDDGDDEGAGAPVSSTTTSTVVFRGDPGSPFCALLREVQLQGLLGGEAATAQEVEAGFTQVLAALGRVAEEAPPELQEDTALVLAGVAALDDALRAVGYRDEALAADPALAVEVSKAANDPAFAQASARIEAYKDQVCGL
jgi:hypothetical protein